MTDYHDRVMGVRGYLDDAVRVSRGQHLAVPGEGEGQHRDVVAHELLVRLHTPPAHTTHHIRPYVQAAWVLHRLN